MVHPQAVDDAFVQPAQYEAVAVGKNGVLLDPDAYEVVYVEEPPVLALLGRRPPESQTVVLALQESVQRVGVRADGLGLGRLGGLENW